MDEENSQDSAGVESNLKKQFTTVTPVSKYLALLLFISLPFGGFWLGIEYVKQTQMTDQQGKAEIIVVTPTCEEIGIPQNKIDSVVAEAIVGIDNPWGDEADFQLLLKRIQDKLNCTLEISRSKPELGNDGNSQAVKVIDEPRALLKRISDNYEFHFTEPEEYSFEWRWYKYGEDTPETSIVEGFAIQALDFSLQDKDEEYASSTYRLDAEIIEYFELIELLEQSTANTADHPTRSSLLGFQSGEIPLVCLRMIEDTGSEFTVYRIACGFLDYGEPRKKSLVGSIDSIKKVNGHFTLSIQELVGRQIEYKVEDDVFGKTIYEPVTLGHPVSLEVKANPETTIKLIRYDDSELNHVNTANIQTLYNVFNGDVEAYYYYGLPDSMYPFEIIIYDETVVSLRQVYVE